MMKEGTFRTICQFCHTNCGIIVHRGADGTLSVEGDPDHPVNRGRCCAKVAAIPEIVRSEDRLRHPLKKTPNGFKKISWDEALRFATDKLGEIRSKYGPLSLMRCGGAPVSYQCRDAFMQFMGEFGSPNFTGAANLCMVPRMTAFNAVTGGLRAEPDYDGAKLVLFWATNPLASERFGAYAAYNGLGHIIPRLKERGVRIISIDPFRTKTVRQADEWVRINPGTDVALGLAMIHVIIKEGLYDKAFVEEYTSGFEALAAHVQTCSPKWAEPLTGIPGKTIEELARTYATTKPAAIYEGNGLDMYANGVDSVRTVAMLIGLTGNLDVAGGNVFMPFAIQSSLPTKAVPRNKRLRREQFPIFIEVPFPAVKDALLRDEEDRPRAMIVHHCNPVLVQANEERTRRAMEKLDFLMVNEIFPTATSEIADLVLPVTSDFESYGYRAYSSVEGGFVALARPVSEPVGESRPVFEVEYELAERMGFQENYPFHDTESWLQFMISPCDIPLERLKEEQIVYATPPVQYKKYVGKGFNTTSGKVEFYSRKFEDGGYSPIPSYTEPAGEPLHTGNLSEKGFPMLGSSMRLAQFVHTKFRNLESLRRLYPEPLVWIHPRDALARGIGEGDEVEVSSPVGKVTLKATLTEDTSAGLVWVDFGWGNPTDGKANINVLVDDTYFDPISGGTPNRLFACEVKKKG
ncbi:MAG: molybdopterin-dependent oxidoreductase [Deltaproteobacteria bacterium]|nr:molybdopterin-dependent oxidoreductase [Deltaproteobacteria bacterium]